MIRYCKSMLIYCLAKKAIHMAVLEMMLLAEKVSWVVGFSL
jgi:hypothetical protein